MANSIELTRRQLLKTMGGGLLVAAVAPDLIAAGWSQRRSGALSSPQDISAWVHIGKDGKVTIYTGKVEVGQNARTSITQAAAEELHVPPQDVSVVMGDTDLTPFDMGTFGSRTTPTMIPQVRRAAAAAREQIVKLAAKQWGKDPSLLQALDGRVHGGDVQATYGELLDGRKIENQIQSDISITSPMDWKVLGMSLPKVDAEAFVTGRHEYTSDLARPGMLHAVVLRAPSFGATLASVDLTNASKVPGVQVVREGDFIAFVSPRKRDSELALEMVVATWQESATGSSSNLAQILRGDQAIPAVDAPEPSKKLSALYSCAYIAHVPLEPRAALAEWDGQKVTVHTGTQRPFAVRDEVAAALGLDLANVRVIVPDTGSGYGGKHTGDAAVEAARIAKAIGKPIKLVWSRQEEFMWGYFRPGGIAELSGAVNPDGRLAAWRHVTYNAGSPGIAMAYDVLNPVTEARESKSPLRQGSYRGLAATFNNFARESHIDELAHLAGLDPLEFRLTNLINERLRAVLESAAEKIGWKTRTAAPGRGFGIACGTEKNGCIATAVEVSVELRPWKVTVLRAVSSFECGAILNPDLLLNQVNGAVIMGLGGALFEEIEFENGKLKNGHLSLYRVPRYTDIPVIESTLLDRKDLPSAGAGETPIMAIAPAIGNAIFAATGRRLRAMPLAG